MISRLLAAIGSLGPWAYAVEGALIFAEDALFFGFVLPGETVLVFCAVLAQQHHLSVVVVLLVAVVFAVLGDQVGFEIGRHFGPALRESAIGRRIGDTRWEQASDLLDKRGGPAVFAARWVAFLRAIVPTSSGIVKMKRSTFTLWNTVGSLAWSLTWTGVGYLAGASWERMAQRFGELAAAISIVVIAVALSPLARKWFTRIAE